jgi:hypothetical protein
MFAYWKGCVDLGRPDVWVSPPALRSLHRRIRQPLPSRPAPAKLRSSAGLGFRTFSKLKNPWGSQANSSEFS